MAVIQSLIQLIVKGQIPDNNQELAPILKGLAHACEKGWVLSERLLQARQTLASDAEWVVALLATQYDHRTAWLRIMAARCQEAGQLQDKEVLVQLVSRLGEAASWVEAEIQNASLTPTPFKEDEHVLLGLSAEQNAATPLLTRVLATAAQFASWREADLPTLNAVESSGAEIKINWCRGRLLVLPGQSVSGEYLLQNLNASVSDEPLDWILTQPWALLLTMITYAQYIWAAENRGGLLLELTAGQSVYQPAEVQVLVQGPEGDEMLCGSLAELVLKVLKHLEMACFPAAPTLAELNQRLALLIGELLKRQIWQYREGGSNEQGQYLLHPDFTDTCFTIQGVKTFKLQGLPLWQAVRFQSEQWYKSLKPHLRLFHAKIEQDQEV